MSDTIWSPRLTRGARPIYQAIADALEHDLGNGVLREGERLPTHRELAIALEVTPLTITRAYQEAGRRGLIESTVGRGTFVRRILAPMDPAHAARGVLDLSKNVVAATEQLDLDPRMIGALRTTVREADYLPTAGSPRHRAAGAAWMKRSGIVVSPESVLVTPGAQQAILAILAAICRPGDTIAVEALTYPRFSSIAAMLHLKMIPIEVDEHGLSPRSLVRSLRRAKALYCVPNFQNPTGSVMPERRRKEIAGIIRDHRALLIEDDVYGFLLDPVLPPISTLVPERACYVASTSKSLSPALRLGFSAVPESLVDQVTEACGSITAFTSSISAELFALLMESGATDRCIAAKRELITRNRHAAERALGARTIRGHRMSPHIWLPLPVRCDAHELSDRARMRGVAVAPAASFVTANTPSPNAIRVSLGATMDTHALENALRTLAGLIDEPRSGRGTVV